MDVLGPLHTTAAAAALALGPAVFARRKGDRRHRRLGYAYLASMAALNATALAIYDLFGAWGPFHWLALLSLATLAAGFLPALLRRPANWLEWHYFGMCWSYVGLAAAGVAELLTRAPRLWPELAAAIPPHYFWIAIALSTAAAGGLGTWLLRVRRLGFPAAGA